MLIDEPYTIMVQKVTPRRITVRGRWMKQPWKRKSATSAPSPTSRSSQNLDTHSDKRPVAKVPPGRALSRTDSHQGSAPKAEIGASRRKFSFTKTQKPQENLPFDKSWTSSRKDLLVSLYGGTSSAAASIYDGFTSAAANIADLAGVVSQEEAVKRINEEVGGLKDRVERFALRFRARSSPTLASTKSPR